MTLQEHINDLIKIAKGFKLSPDKKQRWIDALRSGDYEQGKKYLKDENGAYCCLGVFADVDPTYKFMNSSDEYFAIKIDSDEDNYKYHSVISPEDLLSEIQNELYYLNDCVGLSFNKIADIIEAAL